MAEAGVGVITGKMSRIELKNMSFKYEGRDETALEDISGVIETGSLTAVIGANGSGKSTLGRIIAGLLAPTEGEIVRDDEGVIAAQAYGSDEWNRVGMLFQYPDEQLIAQSVEHELAWGLENIGVAPNEMERRVEQALVRFGLEDKRDRQPDTLSDGWKQIAALAAIAVMEPDFLVLDEATSFLDKPSRAKVWALVKELAHEMGVVWISTEATEAREADRVCLLQEGRLAGQGSPSEVLQADLLRKAGVKPV